uniref:Glycosyl hydrolase family 95 N-terminal domain-containing protein n=1 Tax=Aegilops tauschii subsp. strangulata TaxID=200361 RepID=A0A453SIT9_AEGTS
ATQWPHPSLTQTDQPALQGAHCHFEATLHDAFCPLRWRQIRYTRNTPLRKWKLCHPEKPPQAASPAKALARSAPLLQDLLLPLPPLTTTPLMDGDRVRARRRADEEAGERPLKVVFASPAEHFTDSAPIGNGSLGAMVWGGVASEKLQLNLDTLWSGVPGDYTDPKAPAALAAVRKLVDEGRFVDATNAASGLFGGLTEVCYMPWCSALHVGACY